MQTIKSIAPKPSDALVAMVCGIIKQSERPDFEIRMQSFGMVDYDDDEKEICCGCAATCALQEIAQKNFVDENINTVHWRAKYLGFEVRELVDFEAAINQVRYGDLTGLFVFYGIVVTIDNARLTYILFDRPMLSHNWQQHTQAIIKHAELLKQNGL